MSSDEVPLYFAEISESEVLARASDFLHQHSSYAGRDPWDLPPAVTAYFMHLAEHMCRYMGVLPSDREFFTPHMRTKALVCDDDYAKYVDVAAELRSAGLDPDDPNALGRLEEELRSRLNEDEG